MKNIAFFLLFFLLVSGHSNANAVGGSIGGWNVVSNVASGIGAKITASKEVLVNGAKTTVTGTANIMPDPSNMGKFMARLGGAAIVSEAVNQLLNGVDYVMDPVNNTVRKKISDGTITNDNFTDNTTQLTGDALCFKIATDGGFSPRTDLKCTLVNSGTNSSGQNCFTSIFYRSSTERETWKSCLANATYTEPEVKYEDIPIATVSAQILDQAEEDIKAGNPTSPAVALSRAVAQDIIQEAEADDVKARPIATELDKNTSYPSDTDIEGEITTPEVIDSATGEVVKPAETSSIAMQFPKACEWFPQLCLFIDWMQKPQELDEPDLPTKEIEKKEIDEELIKISSSSCPAPIDVNIPLPVFNTTYTDSISVSEYCPKIEKLAPVLQLLAFVLAIMIIKDI